MIKLISGCTRMNGHTLRPADGPFSADPDVEARLVAAGVAVPVHSADDETAKAVLEKEGTRDGAGTPLPAEGDDRPGDTRDSSETAAEGAGEAAVDPTGPFEEDTLYLMTNSHLKEIAEGLGLNVSTMRKKADYVEAILQAQNSGSEEAGEDGDTPPELSAEEPVT